MSDSWMGSLADQSSYQPAGDNPWPPDPNIHTASPLVNITPQDIDTAQSMAMGFSGGGLGIKAYHSSPYDFDAFDLAKIGSGEGNQSFGHGLYFAENPNVSDQGGMYWRQFVTGFKDPERTAARYLKAADFDRQAATQSLQNRLSIDAQRVAEQGLTGKDLALHNAYTAKQNAVLSTLQGDQPIIGPRTYQVDINADPSHLLNWDKPLQDQPHVVNAAPELLDFARQEAKDRAIGALRPERAKQLWSMVENPLQAPGSFGVEPALLGKGDRPAQLSALMQSRGIPGIKYFDEGSRSIPGQVSINRKIINDPTAPQAMRDQAVIDLENWQKKNPTNNYVIFDPRNIRIDKKYALPAATAGGMGALAAQDSYNQGE